MKKISIVGAGHIGQALSQLFLEKDYEVMICNSKHPYSLAPLKDKFPDLQLGSLEQVAHFSEVVCMAIPFSNYNQINPLLFKDKIILDSMNYYPDRDGHVARLDLYQTTTSSMVAMHFAEAKVIKAFNAILAKDIVNDAKLPLNAQSRALPIAGNDLLAKQIISSLFNDIGYATVDAGSLEDSWRFERAKPAYCIPLNQMQLVTALKQAQREQELPYNSWHRN